MAPLTKRSRLPRDRIRACREGSGTVMGTNCPARCCLLLWGIRTGAWCSLVLAASLAACGGSSGPVTYTIGGTVNGLGGTLELRSSTGGGRTVHADGGFAFPVPAGTPYEVTVATQPDAQTCTVANGSGIANANVTDITIDCRINVGSGRFAYTTESAASTVNVYAVDAATGGFSAPVGAPAATRGTGACALRMLPSGQLLYALNTDSVAAFSVDPATGALAPVPGSPFAAGPVSGPLTLDDSGSYLYMLGAGGVIVGFRIDPATGALTPVPGSPFSVTYGPMPATPIDLTANGGYIYIVDQNSSPMANSNPGVVSLKIDPASGALSPAGTYEVIEFPWSLVFSKDKAFGYVSAPDYFSGSFGVYAVDAQTGALTDTTLHAGFAGLAGPMAFDARQAYALAPIQDPGFPGVGPPYNEVQSLPINHTTGGIDGPVQHSIILDVAPAELKTDPADRYVYVRIYTGEFAEVLPFDVATGAMGPPEKPAMARACDLVFY